MTILPFFLINFLTVILRKTFYITSNAVGCDCISCNKIISLVELVTSDITKINNKSVSTYVFPYAWKDAYVIPLPKKNKACTPSDYLPISILPFLPKVLKKLVHYQLINFLNSSHLFNPLQSGFRTGHSATTALTKITDDIMSTWRHIGMDNQQMNILSQPTIETSIPSKHFDSFPHRGSSWHSASHAARSGSFTSRWARPCAQCVGQPSSVW